MTPANQLSIITAILWAAAIIAAAIVKAPGFYTLILLPILAFSSLGAIRVINRRPEHWRVWQYRNANQAINIKVLL
jgi:hypothetical protein